MPKANANWVNPEDFKDSFAPANVINVEGVQVPWEIVEATDGASEETLAVKARCPDHLEGLSCPERERCYRVHFLPLEVLNSRGTAELRSAGHYVPTAGLLHFVQEGKAARQCENWDQQGSCKREWKCTFLHRLTKPSAAQRKRAEMELAKLTGDSPAKSKKPAVPKPDDAKLFPSLGDSSSHAAPAAVQAAGVKANGARTAAPTKPERQQQMVSGAPMQPHQPAAAPVPVRAAAPELSFDPSAATTIPQQLLPGDSAPAQVPMEVNAFLAEVTSRQTLPSDNMASLGLLAADIQATAGLDPHTLESIPLSDRPTAQQAADAVRQLYSLVSSMPLGSTAHRGALHVFLGAVSQLVELCAFIAPPTARHAKAPPAWISFARDVAECVAPVLASRPVITLFLEAAATGAGRRPSLRSTLQAFVKVVSNLLHPDTPSVLRDRFANAVDGLTLLELCAVVTADARGAGNIETMCQPLRAFTVHLMYNRESDFDAHARAYVAEAYRNALSPNDDESEATDSWLGLAQQRIVHRLAMLKSELMNPHIIDPALMPFEAVLFHIEQLVSKCALDRSRFDGLLMRGGAGVAPRGVAKINAVKAPPSAPAGQLWLALQTDASVCLAFPQWMPSLFIGQHVTIEVVSGAEPSTTRFQIQSIEAYRLYVRCATPGAELPRWSPDKTVLRVTIDHNPWFISSLIQTMRNPKAGEFFNALSSFSLPGPRRPPPTGELPTTLSIDDCQRKFVIEVLSEPRLSILHGPPGTGKTHCIATAIQCIARLGRGRVLACATNVYAANVLATLLVSANVRVLRVFSKSSAPLDVKRSTFGNLLQYSNPVVEPGQRRRLAYDEITLDAEFENATIEDLRNAEVVVTTTAHTSWMQRVPVEFRFVFIDEAAQATAAESLIPITFTKEDATIVLAGDHLQTRPPIIADAAREHDLDKSLMERYQDYRAAFAKQNPDVPLPVCSTSLQHCYRCHKDILDLFNGLFYGQLRKAVDDRSLVPVRCAFQPNRASRFMFVDIPPGGEASSMFGLQAVDDGAFSAASTFVADRFHNPAEADAVAAAVKVLLRDNGPEFARHIGVITSFKHQVLEIQARLRELQSDILVGTVEQFQGQERAVVIISMVRHTRDSLIAGSSVPVGFVGNPRKTNVALSRAASLLVVMGSKTGLQRQHKDEPWRFFVEFAQKKGCITTFAHIRNAPPPPAAAPVASMPKGKVAVAAEDEAW